MPQYNPNPNMTSTTEQYEVGETGTLTATSDGGRWRHSRNVNHFTAPNFVLNMWEGWVPKHVNDGGIALNTRAVMPQIKIRNNHKDSTGISMVDFSVWSTNGWVTDYIPLADAYFPVGSFISLPWIESSGLAKNRYSGYFNTQAIIRFYAVDEGLDTFFDYTIKGLQVWNKADAPAEAVIDGNDATYTATVPNDSLTAVFQQSDPNELIDKVSWYFDNNGTLILIPGVAEYPNTSKYENAPASAGNGGRQIIYKFTTAGKYNVRLKSTNNFNGSVNQTAETTREITVPSGDFIADYAYEISYLDASVDGGVSTIDNKATIPVTYDWDWGDGSAHGTKRVDEHTYAGGGDYPVRLTITNALGQSSTIVKTLHIEDLPTPEADFTAEKDFLSVKYIPNVTGGTFTWNFGDGTNSSLESPVHVYETPGTYTVTMTWDGPLGVVNKSREILVVATYTPIERFVDALRLELAIPPNPGDLYNYIDNPSGELGGYGYITPAAIGGVRGTNLTYKGVDGWKLIFEGFDGTVAQNFETEKIRCNPGEYVNWTMQAFGNGYYRAIINFYNSDGVFLSSGIQSPYYAPGGTREGPTPALAPANTFYATLRVDYYSGNTGSNPTDANYLIFRRVMVAKADTSGELVDIPYTEANNWLNVIGETFEISINRQELDVGILTALIRDAELDPSRSAKIRPGQRVRLRAATQDLAGNTVWENIYSGKTDNAIVDYERHVYELVPDEDGEGSHYESDQDPLKTVINLSAYDRIKEMGILEPRGMYRISDLPFILEGKGIPWVINNSSDQVADAQIVSLNQNSTLIDQVSITRDTNEGFAFMNRNNVLVAYDPQTAPTQTVGLFDEADYSGIDVDFDTDACINSVGVTWLRYTSADGEEGQEGYVEAKTEEIQYGPYVNQDSIDEWGLHHEDFTIHGLVESEHNIENFAQAILDKSSVPKVRVHAVAMPIYNSEDIRLGKAVVDLYDLVTVVYSHSDISDNMRVTTIEHSITNEGWNIGLGFKHDGAVASPQATPSPPPVIPQIPGAWEPGMVIMFGGSNPPDRWFLCNGQGFSKTAYPELADVVQDIYKTHSGDIYYLPDFKNRAPVGVGSERALGTSDGLAESSRTPSHNHNAANLSTGKARDFSGEARRVTSGNDFYAYPKAYEEDHTHNVTGTTNNSGGWTGGNSGLPHQTISFIIKA